MRLGLVLGYSGARFGIDMDLIRHAEALGFSSVWTAEAYGSDAVSPAAWILAQTSRIRVGTGIMQMAARTPATAAMTAMTLQALSDGRFILGIGPSGPQVIEGWHGVPYGRPITRTREYVAIVRKILAREQPLTHRGHHYRIPNTGPGTTGLGKPLKSILHGDPGLPIYTGAMTDAGVRTAAAIADGVLPRVHEPPPPRGVRRRHRRGPGRGRRAAAPPPSTSRRSSPCSSARTSMPAACRSSARSRSMSAAWARATATSTTTMSPRSATATAAARIQELFLAGEPAAAAAAVPDGLVDALALVGPRERIVERLSAWKEAGARGEVGTLLAGEASKEALDVLAEAVL